MDLEHNVAPAVQASKPKPMSSFRKWGPAMVAVAGVIAFNAALMGPTGSRIPELTEQHLNRRALAEARTAEVLAMAPLERRPLPLPWNWRAQPF
jgi:hypothetical protein